jgi:hypothetical protein
MPAPAAQFGDVPHFLAVLAAVLPVLAALGDHARASRVGAFLGVSHDNLPQSVYRRFFLPLARWRFRFDD